MSAKVPLFLNLKIASVLKCRNYKKKTSKNQTTTLVYYLAHVTFSGFYLGCFILLVPDKPGYWDIFQGPSKLSFRNTPMCLYPT